MELPNKISVKFYASMLELRIWEIDIHLSMKGS
jgi:hypothetical protein